MNFLVTQIREQKILDMEVIVDEFIKENNISDQAVIYEMVFDKSVFKEEKEVREYLKDKYFWSPAITDNGDKFTASMVSTSQIDEDTNVEIDLRRGVVAKAADLLPVPHMCDVHFNDKGEVNLSSKFMDNIHLSEGMPHIIEIARVAEGEHPAYGKLKITQDDLESMELNFNSKVTGVDLAVNEDHKKNEAFGWFKDVFLSFDKQTLYGQVQWNTKGVTALSEKDYRYFSPEFRFKYVHPLSGESHGTTLLGGALTNYPFLKMEAITQLNNKPTGEEDVPKENTIDLSVHTDMMTEVNLKLSGIQVELNTKISENATLTDEVKTLKDSIALNAKKSAHEKLFNDGHINAVQLKAMNEGKDFVEVLALSSKTIEKPNGGGSNPQTNIELNDSQKKAANQLGLTDEEYNAVEL